MRVLFVARAFPPIIGGIENQNEALTRYLAKKATVTNIVNTKGKKWLPVFLPYAVLMSLLNLRKVDIVILGDGVCAPIGWVLKLVSKKPVVCVLHGLDITWQNTLYQALWVKFFLKRLDRFIAVSRSTKELALHAGLPEEKIIVVSNGVELSNKKPYSKAQLQRFLNINLEGKFILLSLGRLIKRKGFQWFVDHVAPQLPSDTLYLMAGSGPDDNKIKSTIEKHSLEQRVFLLDQVNEQTKQSLFHCADLFIQPNIPVPNDVEGFGITQIEAGICGLPSLSSDLEGLKDAVTHDRNGWLISSKDSDIWTNAIENKRQYLENNSDFRAQVAQFCHNNFSWELIVDQYLEHLAPLLKKHHRAGFSPTTDRLRKAQKIKTILEEQREKPLEGLSILDIGTGNGEIATFLSQNNDVTSIDIRDTRQIKNDFNFNFVLCNEALPFQSDHFDIVISNHVIEHVNDQNEHVSEIKRVLKPNGTVYLATPNRLWPYEVHYRLPLLHYLPSKQFHACLKFFNLYEEIIWPVLSVEAPSTMMYSISHSFCLITLCMVCSMYFSALKQTVMMVIFGMNYLA